MNEQLKSKTNEIELLKNNIADLQKCMEERRINGRNIKKLPLLRFFFYAILCSFLAGGGGQE